MLYNSNLYGLGSSYQLNHSNGHLSYQSSFDYDDLFKDLKSDNYLKNFTLKRQDSMTIGSDNQIRSNYQNTFQSQQNQDTYFSSINNNHPLQPTNMQYEDPYSSYLNKQNSPPKNSYNVQASSYVPTFHNGNSPPRNPSLIDNNSPPRYPSPINNSPPSTSNNFFGTNNNYGISNNNYTPNNYFNNNNSNFNTNTNNNMKDEKRNISFEENQFPSLSSRKGNVREVKREEVEDGERYIKNGEDEVTIQVWEENMEEELRRLVKLSERYCVIGYDCEFPGVVYQPKDFDYKDSSLSYPYLKSNVDNLQIIQVGFSLSDEKGNLPLLNNQFKILSWQFNFKFDLKKQAHNTKSIKLLKNAGIDFDLLMKKGIDASLFGKTLLNSGLVMNDKIKWVTFHSMFDYGYLIKMLINQPLPLNESQFFSLFHTFFPTSFDIKYFFHHHTSIKVGGLESISKSFKLERKGVAHQAGSDSLLTVKLFFSILKTYRNQWVDHNFQININGNIFGLNFVRIPQRVY